MTGDVRSRRRHRLRRLAWLALLVAVAWAAGVAWLSQGLVSPERTRVSDSSRPVLGTLVAERAGAVVVEHSVSPAREAGIRPGDRLVAVDGAPVRSADALDEIVEATSVGTVLRVEARRPGPAGEGGVLVDVRVVERRVSPADLGLPYEPVVVRDPWGLALRGWYVPPRPRPGRPAPALAYGHDVGADRRQGLPLARLLHDAGFAVLLLDFAGCGESEGEVVTLGSREAGDLGAALDWLAARPEVDRGRLALAGTGMGATAALRCAGSRADVSAVASDGASADLASTVAAQVRARGVPAWIVVPALLRVAGFRAGYDPREVRPEADVARTRARVLLAHGKLDAEVPFAHAERLARAAGPRGTLVALEGLGHHDPRPAHHAARVARFLREAVR